MSKQQRRSVDLAAGDTEKVQKPAAGTATPAKRSTGSAGKLSTPTSTIATRPTKSSASRSTPTASSAKSSARPSGSTTRSRPQSAILSSASPAVAHRPWASVSSATGSTKVNGAALTGSKRASEDKPLPSDHRSRSTSPIKSILKSPVKQPTIRQPPKASRQSVKGDVKTTSVHTPTRNGMSAPNPSTAEPTKKLRPGLGTRKSTMSVTIEQRLRDISIVHQMLRVAMADDGEDDDEVKEQFGKEADERLAELRAQLEEARTAEAHLALEELSNIEMSTPKSHVDKSDATPPKSLPEDLDRSESQSDNQIEVQCLRDTVASLRMDLRCLQVSLESKESELTELSEAMAAMQAKILEVQSDGEHEAQRCLDMIEELRANLDSLNQAKTSAEHEVQQLETSKQLYVEHFQKYIESLEQQLRQHEDAKAMAAEEHSQVVSALRQELQETLLNKDREANHMQEVVEALQKMVQEVNEAKQREIDSLQDSLTLDHEDVVSKLQVEFDDVVAKSKSQLDAVRATLGVVHASNTELRRASDDAERQHEATVSELKIALDASAAQVAQLCSAKAEGLRQIQRLEDEKGTSESSLRSMKEKMKQKSEKVVMLRKRLEVSDEEYQSLSERIRGVEEELAQVTDQSRSNEQLAEEYHSELSQFQGKQAASEESFIEQLAERERVVTGLEQTVDALRQELHNKDNQLQTLHGERDATAKRTDDATSFHGSQLEKLASQLRTAQSIADQKTTRIRELESALKVTRAELVELTTERRPSESSESDGFSQPMSLRLNRWQKADSSQDGANDEESYDAMAGEELSSQVQGQIAGIQERLRQMGDLNSDLVEHETRLVRKMDKVVGSDWTSSPVAITYRHVEAPPVALLDQENITDLGKDDYSW
ncbi:MAG: hypothetical protein L6R36_002780 [Xanthoria steineri]|nr:MAG: hypothetical protein L6R36_002780 [Xanthoria steineri]